MKLKAALPIVVALSMASGTVPALLAQNPVEKEKEAEPTIVDKIEKESNGNITIEIPEDVLELILTPPEPTKPSEPVIHTGINKLSGYRIQVFSDGRNPQSLESRAKARGNAIVQRFPKYRGQVYTYSKSPNWYTRVGNFRNQEEANEALRELKAAFGAFASEMRVVKCQIVLVKQ